jgi:hypothetical protein
VVWPDVGQEEIPRAVGCFPLLQRIYSDGREAPYIFLAGLLRVTLGRVAATARLEVNCGHTSCGVVCETLQHPAILECNSHRLCSLTKIL